MIGWLMLGVYAAAMWWLKDGGRTPVVAIACKRLADLLYWVAARVAGVAWELDAYAYHLIRRRSLA